MPLFAYMAAVCTVRLLLTYSGIFFSPGLTRIRGCTELEPERLGDLGPFCCCF
jgi:hypothetical protein